jgi:Ca2+-binding RTX toxin-like protein
MANLYGTDGANTLVGTGGDDYLYGWAPGRELFDIGNDIIRAGSGNDYVFGGGGNDTLYGDDGVDYLYGGSGADNLYGGNNDDWVYGGAGNDRIFGENGNDVLYGDGGADRIFAGEGDDLLSGGAGNDWLHGDKGDDTLTGGAGIDRFIFSGDWAVDVVTDFENGVDKLDFDGGSINGVLFVKFSDLLFEMTDADSDGDTDDLLIKTNNTNISKGEISLLNFDISMIDPTDFVSRPGFFV